MLQSVLNYFSELHINTKSMFRLGLRGIYVQVFLVGVFRDTCLVLLVGRSTPTNFRWVKNPTILNDYE